MLNDEEREEIDQLPDGMHPLDRFCPICKKNHEVDFNCQYCHSVQVSILVRGNIRRAQCQQCWQTFSIEGEEEEEGILTVNVADGVYQWNKPCQFCHSERTVFLVQGQKLYGKCKECGLPLIPDSVPEEFIPGSIMDFTD